MKSVDPCSGTQDWRADLALEPGKKYHKSPHVYTLQRAIELMKLQGMDNWAGVAENHLQDLADGAKFADGHKGRAVLHIRRRVLIFIPAGTWATVDLFNAAGMDHYYNPTTNAGLDLSKWDVLKEVGPHLIAELSSCLTTGGLIGATVEIEPQLLSHYPSAADLCQQKYDQAFASYTQGRSGPDRGIMGLTMFQLGWSCHFVADMGMVSHTFDDWISNHQAFEDYADGRGGDNSVNETQSIAYDPNWSAREYAVRTAKIIHDRKYFQPVESGDRSRWDEPLRVGLKAGEQHTAGLLARFMKQAGFPQKTPPLSGLIYRKGGGTIAGAYIFYRRDGANRWDVIRADHNGRYTLPVRPGVKYWIRPAMPGYSYEGFGDVEFASQPGPMPYTQPQGVLTAKQISFSLRPHPQQTGMMVAALPGGMAGPSWHLHPPPGSIAPATVQPGASLPQSGTRLQPGLSETVTKAMLEVRTSAHVLGVQNGGTGMPESAAIDVALYRLIDVRTGTTLTTAQQVAQAIDTARVQLKQGASMQKTSIPDQTAQQTWAAMKDQWPKVTIRSAGQPPRETYVIPRFGRDHIREDSVLKHGIVPVPSMAGCEIEVSAVSGHGYLSAGSTPMRVTTNAGGIAQFSVHPGSHAGKLRLNIRVTRHPGAEQLKPQAALEFVVHPGMQGNDPPQAMPPSFMPVFLVAGVFGQPAGQPRVQMVPGRQTAGQYMVRTDWIPVLPFIIGGYHPPSSGWPQLAQQPGVVQMQPVVGTVMPSPGVVQQGPVQMQPMVGMPMTGAVGMSENFENQPLQGWEIGGNAQVAQMGQGHALVCSARGHGFWLLPPMQDFTLQFRYQQGQGVGEVVMCASGEAPNNQEYHLILPVGGVGLDRNVGQHVQPLGGAQAPTQAGQWYTVSLQASGGQMQVSVNGQPVLTAQDPQPLTGGIMGFGCVEGGGIAYDDIVLTPAGGAAAPQPLVGTIQQPGPVQMQPMVGTPMPGTQQPGVVQMQPMVGVQLPGSALSESFDQGQAQGWQLGAGWQVGQYAAGRSGLHGTQHEWARYTGGTWSDSTLSLRLNLARGGVHVNYRTSGAQRYFVGFRQNTVYLSKQSGPQAFSDLAQSQTVRGVSLNQWHSITVAGRGGQLTVTVDGQTAISYTDPNPLTQGGIAFETLDNSEAWIDDVAVATSTGG